MDAAVDRNAATRPLELLGISAIEERAYRILLERHTATAAEIADCIKTTRRVARKLLGDLEALGLATHTPKVPRVYLAAPPEFAVAALVKLRQAMLEKVRVAIPELEAQSARSNNADGHQPVLELISSHAHLGVVMSQLYESFRNEVMCFQRAPSLAPTVNPPRKLPVGVRVRTISDSSVLEIPGVLERIKEDVSNGEEARMQPALPFKMMIFDRRAAVISLDDERPENAPILLIHGSALLKALCLLFEFVWERATPIMCGRAGCSAAEKGDTSEDALTDALIPLLSAGLNDKAIAMELGVSSATLNRRISKLMKMTGTRTRFQLGWRAALDASSLRTPPRDAV
jgi:sugar-specific transcriptional regulator TrmB